MNISIHDFESTMKTVDNDIPCDAYTLTHRREKFKNLTSIRNHYAAPPGIALNDANTHTLYSQTRKKDIR